MREGAGRPSRRLVGMAMLLLVSLALGAGLAWQAIRTAGRHRETAERALQDYAGFAAFILASQSYRQLGGSVVETFTRWPAGTAEPPVPSGAACASGSAWFQYDPRGSGTMALRGTMLAPAHAQFLRDTLGNAMHLLEEVGWRFRFIRARGEGPQGWFISSFRLRAGVWAIRGVSACFDVAESPLRRVMLSERALPPALTGDLAADSLFSLTAESGDGVALYTSPLKYDSPYRGSARLGNEFGDLTVRLSLRPDIATRLVIGGVPPSPTPIALGLLGLSTLLVVAALVQLRREYELIAIRSRFVANVSHELRTPLSQILIFTELLKLGRLRSRGERERSLAIIDQEARRLIRLVENALQFSGARGARRAMSREPLPLAPLVHDTLEAFRPLALARDVVLNVEVPERAVIEADAGAFRQILLNLLDNAVKYGPRGQTVTIGARVQNGRTRIMVDDQGPGIPRDDRERVWDGYFRLRRPADSAIAGSGIGLAVVRSLAQDQGGRTWIEETDTGGSRFIVELNTGKEGNA
jgi:signal transduction histidine kinase